VKMEYKMIEKPPVEEIRTCEQKPNFLYTLPMSCRLSNDCYTCENRIIEDIYSTFFNEFRILLVYNHSYEKCNAYYIPFYSKNYMCQDVDKIVEQELPISLGLAKTTFPMYKFNEETYGF